MKVTVSEVMTRGVETISAAATLDLAAKAKSEALAGHVLGEVSAA